MDLQEPKTASVADTEDNISVMVILNSPFYIEHHIKEISGTHHANF